MELFYIAGKSGPDKIVSMYHTNKHLSNFHWDISKCVSMFYENAEVGSYLSHRGYQNGYDEIGYMLIIVKNIAHSSSGRTADSDSVNCGSNPW